MFSKLSKRRKYIKYSFNKGICVLHNLKNKADVAPTYVSKNVEKNKYEKWTKNNYFKPSSNKNSNEALNMILPPPNITGVLHLGHAMTVAIEDAIVRWHRMRGVPTLWVPGTDHAGIATQVVVEKKLWHEKGLTRHDIGREKFTELVLEWRREKSEAIGQQLKQLGASLDWSKEFFTMDSKQESAVTEAFIRLFESNLIYRDNALVNWSCVLQSAISDVEVDQVELSGPTDIVVPGYDDLGPVRFGTITEFAYRLCGADGRSLDGSVSVATTRPETMLGDVAVAVHTADERYTHLRVEEATAHVWHPFRNCPIPVVFDEFVDAGFGTGAVKITPAHDRDDFEVARRHNLSSIEVIGEDGRLKPTCGQFSGLRRFEARQVIINELTKLGLVGAIRDHPTTLPVCSRSKDIVELLLKPQWFVKCGDLANVVSEAVRNGQLVIDPPHFQKTWFNWMDNIKDWCVSRQLWWGHRVPAFECWTEDSGFDSHIWVAAKDENMARLKARAKLGDVSRIICKQDDDVLDTWFSSGLLPFSVFGWPENTDALKQHYPLTMMETGHDIIFFWVARMAMLAQALTGKLPFKKVLLHGVICDQYGRKMSKSLGNVILPEDVIEGASLEDLEKRAKESEAVGILSKEEYIRTVEAQSKAYPPTGIPPCGADALRFTLCSHNIKNHFINFDISECRANSLFCNKIWQATRYTLSAIDKFHLRDRLGCDSDDVTINIRGNCIPHRNLNDTSISEESKYSTNQGGRDSGITFLNIDGEKKQASGQKQNGCEGGNSLRYLKENQSKSNPFEYDERNQIGHDCIDDTSSLINSTNKQDQVSNARRTPTRSNQLNIDKAFGDSEAGNLRAKKRLSQDRWVEKNECDRLITGFAEDRLRGSRKIELRDKTNFDKSEMFILKKQTVVSLGRNDSTRSIGGKESDILTGAEVSPTRARDLTDDSGGGDSDDVLSLMDRWIMSRLAAAVREVDTAMHNAELHDATGVVKSFLYGDLCDVYLESTKPGVHGGFTEGRGHCLTLLRCLETGLRLIAPFMPFLADELYDKLPAKTAANMSLAQFPDPNQWDKWRDEKLEKDVESIHEIVIAIRRMRTQIPRSIKEKPKVHIVTSSSTPDIELFRGTIETLSGVGGVVIGSDPDSRHVLVSDTLGAHTTLHLVLSELPPSAATASTPKLTEDLERFKKKETKLQKELEKMMKMTSSEGYQQKASKNVQESHQKKILSLNEELRKVRRLQENVNKSI